MNQNSVIRYERGKEKKHKILLFLSKVVGVKFVLIAAFFMKYYVFSKVPNTNTMGYIFMKSCMGMKSEKNNHYINVIVRSLTRPVVLV